VAWTAPTSGGSVNGYTARAYTKASGGAAVKSCQVSGSATTCDITGLANGTRYFVGVTAASVSGSGTESARISATPRSAPTAPRSVAGSSSARKVTIRWTAPQSTGGSPITGYRAAFYTSASATAAATQCTGTASAKACTTGALVAGKTYWAAVTASNVAGSSPASARVKVVVRK
jgi:hypothetical protein